MGRKKQYDDDEPSTGAGHMRRHGLVNVPVPVLPEERALIRSAADGAHQPVAVWARSVLVEAARRALAETGQDGPEEQSENSAEGT